MSKLDGSRDVVSLIVIHGQLSNLRVSTKDAIKIRWYSRDTNQRLHVAPDGARFLSRIVQDLAEHRNVVVYTESLHTSLDLPGKISRILEEMNLDLQSAIFTPRGIPESIRKSISEMNRWGIVLQAEMPNLMSNVVGIK